MEIFDIDGIILSLLRILSSIHIFTIFEFQRKDHVADQQNHIDTLTQSNDIILKDDIALHAARIQSFLQFLYLIVPGVRLFLIDFKRVLNQLPNNRR